MYQLINFYKVKDLTNSGYKKTSIVNFAGAGIISQSFFILKKEDLPNIISVEIKNDLIEKYSLEKICSDLNIFASVLDLNLVSPEIRAENIGNSTEQELRKSILLSIVQSIEVRWKKEIEVIEIIEYSEYKEMGMPNNLDEVISF